MKCSICKLNSAIIHIREYTDNGLRKVNLCLECAIKKGLNTPAENLDNLLAKIISNVFHINKNYRTIRKNGVKRSFSLMCPSCGKTINEFSSKLEAGCPACYDVFEDIIDLLIFNQNNSLNYLGKFPENLSKLNVQKNALRQLKKDLKKHILSEDFVKAALVRDEIKKLKNKINKVIRKIES